MMGAGPQGPGMMGGGRGMEGHGPMHGGRHGPPPSRAARFHLERGDATIDIRCVEGEPSRACVEAALLLLDKVGTLPAR
ncbi:hypothetical protein ACFQX4_18925 [Roseomonas sp. GCM10028921]